MKKTWAVAVNILALLILLIPSYSFNRRTVDHTNIVAKSENSVLKTGAATKAVAKAHFDVLYDSLELGALELSRQAFQDAVRGFIALQADGAIHNTDVLSIVDFSLPSNKKRLFIIDMQNGRLLFNTWVAHGRNSGKLMATRFSNRINSNMSSLGFYVTGDSFNGQHGYSLHLDGVEPGWNDHVNKRAIIMHSAEYVSQQHIDRSGYLGRSQGCPAIPEDLDRPIIDQIRGGSCLFIYAPNTRYQHRSNLIS